MSEESGKHKRKAKAEDGPDKKVKLESTSNTFEVQPEVEVKDMSICIAARLTFNRIFNARRFGGLFKTISVELRKVRTNLKSFRKAESTTMSICDCSMFG